MSDLKCAGMQLQPIDRPGAIVLAGALIEHVDDLRAELEREGQ